MLLLRKVAIVLEGTPITHKDAVVHHYVRCFLFHAVDTVLVEFII